MSTSEKTYRGRFAPSPTGPLHFGSLVAATASYLDARHNQGAWLVRMEDLDKPREMLGAADQILLTLEQFGFEWDEPVVYQSARNDLYQYYAQQLRQQHQLYPCACTRKDIETIAQLGIEGLVYPGTCRNGLGKNKQERAWRLKLDDQVIEFEDCIQGLIKHDLLKDIGDFVIKRADGLYAYQLAVVVDDEQQGITHVVRGADLLNSTTRQIFLQRQLGFNTPSYAHNPLAVNTHGEKLSKQTRAPALDVDKAGQLICNALTFLGMNTPNTLALQPIQEIWKWAISNWNLNQVPQLSQLNQELI